MPEDESKKTTWKRRYNKAKKVIIDGIKDQILPSIAKLTTAYEMFKTIQDTYVINSASKLLTLLQQLINIKMDKGDTISSYFSLIYELRDQLSTIGNNIDNVELSLIALRGLPLSWESFIQCISRPTIPKFDQLKNDCTQGESRLISRGIISNKEEEIQALRAKSNNNKGKSKRKRV